MATDAEVTGPLRGLLVADFSRILAGPYATMLLADLGAEVVKVEGPRGDDTRTWMPPTDEDGTSTYYLGINRNKRSIALNLKDEHDLRLAKELAGRADVLIENMKPGGMARFGLGYDQVAETNPGVVYASITGFGTEEGASLPGYDLMVQGVSGLMSLTGPPGQPHRAGISVFDVMTGMHATIGILSALHHRDVTGEGQHVEVNLLSSAMSGLVNHTSAVVAGGVNPTSMGNAHPSLFPYEPLPTKDGAIIVIVGNDGQFRTFCDLIERPELPDDPRFSSNEQRTANRDELEPILVEALSHRTTAEWFAGFREVGLAGGPVNTVEEGVAFAEELGLEPVVEVGEPGDAKRSIRNPITFSATPASYRRRPPELDEHRAELEAWLLERDAEGAA